MPRGVPMAWMDDLYDHPPVWVSHGGGARFTDVDGHTYADFNIADMAGIDKETLTAALNSLVDADHPVTTRWITDAELEAAPHLVRTMSVKPPMGSGKVRLVAIGNDGAVDLQPCGGTHVARTGEIGRLAVTKIESKGKQNRRIRVALSCEGLPSATSADWRQRADALPPSFRDTGNRISFRRIARLR